MRSAETYRGARRNRCLREEKGVWGPFWYYEKHKQTIYKKKRSKIKETMARVASAFNNKNKIATPQVVSAPKQVRPTGRGQ